MKPGRTALVGTAAAFLAAGAVLACGGGEVAVGTDVYFPLAYGDHPTKAELAALGRKMFFDPSLSASGQEACATCHSPDHAFGPPNALSVQRGGPQMDRVGFRNAPSLRYLHAPVAFTEHFMEREVSGSLDDEGPTGGHTWDGRVNTGHEQAMMPLLDPNEMANASREEVIDRLRKSAYADEFRSVVSAPREDVFDNPDAVIGWLGVALETFEQSPPDFHPFTSKYDAWLRREVELTPAEQRGLAVFNDFDRGNCVSCHPGALRSPQQHSPIFTDFGYIALGVPRNRELAANHDPAFYDLGLCGPLRSDLKKKDAYCGMFRTPSLRNVAERESFFHNGAFHSLRQVLEFYRTRDTAPQRWYPRDAAGQVQAYDDLPAKYRANVYDDAPFTPHADGRPRLRERDVDDLMAFLKTLSDGYVVPKSAVRAARRTAPVPAAPQAAARVASGP